MMPKTNHQQVTNKQPTERPTERTAEQTTVIDRLKRRIRTVETSSRMATGEVVPSGCAAIDRLLPAAGYSRGTLVQWLTAGGQGADYLSLLTAMQACRDGGALVVVDRLNQFNPVAAAALGVNLDHLIVLRNSATNSGATAGLANPNHSAGDLQDNDFLWAIDQALRCPAVAAVWGWLDVIDARWFRRFQLSAEASGCLGLLIQPLVAARVPTWAEVQWLVQGEPATHAINPEQQNQQPTNEQFVRLQLTRCHGTHTGKKICLGINTVTGNVVKQKYSGNISFNRVPSGPRVKPLTARGDAHAV